MKRLLLAVLALGASALAVPAGGAATVHDTRGGCAFESVEVTTHGEQRGLMYELSVTTDGGIGTAPIGATVTCWIDVNGIEAPGTRHTYGDLNGPGVQAGADPISFTAHPHDFVNECQSVHYADGTTSDPDFDCPAIAPIGFPPQAILDFLNFVERTAQGAVCDDHQAAACALLCPELGMLAGDYGPVTIAPDGDVVVIDDEELDYNPVFDCPPYVSEG